MQRRSVRWLVRVDLEESRYQHLCARVVASAAAQYDRRKKSGGSVMDRAAGVKPPDHPQQLEGNSCTAEANARILQGDQRSQSETGWNDRMESAPRLL